MTSFVFASGPFDIFQLPNGSRSTNENNIRARCRSAYLGNNETLSVCLGRYKMFLDTTDAGFAPHIMLDGFWEYWITQFIASAVKPGMVTMDVGANFGYYSVMMADLAGPSGRCMVVEPNPAVADRLQRTLDVNGFHTRAPLTRAALSDAESDGLTFFVPRNEPKNARIVPEDFGDPDGTVIQVKSTTLDNLSAVLTRLDFIKIDAEGAEAGIVAGMKETFLKHRPKLLLEFNAARNGIEQMLDTLFDYTHEMMFVDYDGRPKPVTRERLMSEHVGEDWMLYIVPKGDAAHHTA